MNIQYFSPEMPDDNKSKKADKGLMNRNDLMENAKKRAQKVEQSKSTSGLMAKNEGKLLTDDGREILK